MTLLDTWKDPLNNDLYLLSLQRRPSGKQSLPVPWLGSRPQSLGNNSSRPVAWGDWVPSSTNLPPPNRLVTGANRLRIALKNCALATVIITERNTIFLSLMFCVKVQWWTGASVSMLVPCVSILYHHTHHTTATTHVTV